MYVSYEFVTISYVPIHSPQVKKESNDNYTKTLVTRNVLYVKRLK
jgi:hypothetical protein